MSERGNARYFHGGPAGLRAILPPSQTGKWCTANLPEARGVARRDAVYVTTNYTAACMYAACHETPCVYEVEPANPRHDPDCQTPGLSFEADSAAILSRHKVPGKVIKKVRRELLRGAA